MSSQDQSPVFADSAYCGTTENNRTEAECGDCGQLIDDLPDDLVCSKSAAPSGELKYAAVLRRKYKPVLCRHWSRTGTCPYGDSCAFAHGVAELRTDLPPEVKYKTVLCRHWSRTGTCPYGDSCVYAHGVAELRTDLPPEVKMGTTTALLASRSAAAALAPNATVDYPTALNGGLTAVSTDHNTRYIPPHLRNAANRKVSSTTDDPILTSGATTGRFDCLAPNSRANEVRCRVGLVSRATMMMVMQEDEEAVHAIASTLSDESDGETTSMRSATTPETTPETQRFQPQVVENGLTFDLNLSLDSCDAEVRQPNLFRRLACFAQITKDVYPEVVSKDVDEHEDEEADSEVLPAFIEHIRSASRSPASMASIFTASQTENSVPRLCLSPFLRKHKA